MLKNSNEEDIFDDVESVDREEHDDPELHDIEENSTDSIKKLKAKLKECEGEKMEYLENLQRAKAEFLNGKRRIEEERSRDKERAITTQIEKLIPLCDSFQIALRDTKGMEASDANWRTGIEGIYTQLQSILTSYNVHETNPIGEEFNPNVHEAVTTVTVTDNEQNNTIISVIQNGYVRTVQGGTELIRPARVTVGEYSA